MIEERKEEHLWGEEGESSGRRARDTKPASLYIRLSCVLSWECKKAKLDWKREWDREWKWLPRETRAAIQSLESVNQVGLLEECWENGDSFW